MFGFSWQLPAFQGFYCISDAGFQSPTFIQVSWLPSICDMDLQLFKIGKCPSQPRLVNGSDQPLLEPLVSPGSELRGMPGIAIYDALQVA